MSLLTQLQDDMKTAMKSGDKERLGVIRMLISEVKNIDLAPKKLSEEETVAAYGKKLRKAREEFEKVGNTAQTAQLAREIEIVDAYLPKKADSGQTQQLVETFLSSNSFTQKQIGAAIGGFMKAHGGQVDPAVASALIREKLAGK